VCPLTTKEVESSLLRIGLLPTAENGLAGPSWIMVDKILTVPRTKVGQYIGEITLAPGAHRATFRAAKSVKGFLLDLHELRLIPRQAQSAKK